jgi:hypothetical protein
MIASISAVIGSTKETMDFPANTNISEVPALRIETFDQSSNCPP